MIESEIKSILPKNIKDSPFFNNIDYRLVRQIRIRVGNPVRIEENDRILYGPLVTAKDIDDIINLITKYSVYAFEEEIRQGFITIAGGHRVGLCGRVIRQKGEIRTIREITSVNIRVAHQVRGCADFCINNIFDGGDVKDTLIFSKAGLGKTTLLRDIIRQMSEAGKNVSVIDEREEISAPYMRELQNEVGKNTDVIIGIEKTWGIELLIRTMAPDIIAMDEISEGEINKIIYAKNSGCNIIATIHASNMEEVFYKIKRGIFERYIGLDEKQNQIYDEGGEILQCYLK